MHASDGDVTVLWYFFQGTPDAKIFAKPLCLGQLARFTLQAYCSMVR